MELKHGRIGIRQAGGKRMNWAVVKPARRGEVDTWPLSLDVFYVRIKQKGVYDQTNISHPRRTLGLHSVLVKPYPRPRTRRWIGQPAVLGFHN